MRNYFLFLFIGIAFLSCTKDDDMQHSELIGKTFDHLFYATEQDCLNAQPDPNSFINCHQELSINDNENAVIILTDIIYAVKYSMEKGKLIIHANAKTVEFHNDLTFELIHTSSLKLLSNNSIWNERVGDSLWD